MALMSLAQVWGIGDDCGRKKSNKRGKAATFHSNLYLNWPHGKDSIEGLHLN